MLRRKIDFVETIYHGLNGHSASTSKIANDFVSTMNITPLVEEYKTLVELHSQLYSLALKNNFEYLVLSSNLTCVHAEMVWWKIYHSS